MDAESCVGQIPQKDRVCRRSEVSTYIISDIHGCDNEFLSMLEKIRFSGSDNLILAGDYIDRGKQSYEMLKWMEQCPPNVLLLRGNHEEEFVSNVELIQSVDLIEELNTDFSSHTDTVALYESVKYLLRQKNLPAVYFDFYGTIGMLSGKALPIMPEKYFVITMLKRTVFFMILTVAALCRTDLHGTDA